MSTQSEEYLRSFGNYVQSLLVVLQMVELHFLKIMPIYHIQLHESQKCVIPVISLHRSQKLVIPVTSFNTVGYKKEKM